jgi:hypothetical protein
VTASLPTRARGATSAILSDDPKVADPVAFEQIAAADIKSLLALEPFFVVGPMQNSA